MPADLPTPVSPDIRERAARIRLIAFDVDGTLTDGRLWYAADGHEVKAFHAHDGQGIRLLQQAGIEVALITARDSAPVTLRARDLDISHVFQGQKDKQQCLRQLQQALQVTVEQTAFVGDDLPDLAAMQVAGLAIAVANAHPAVRTHTDWQTTCRGGEGAVREVCDLLLSCQGKLPALPDRPR